MTDAKVRTSITIDPSLLEDARNTCEAEGRSFSALVQDAVSEYLLARRTVPSAEALGALP